MLKSTLNRPRPTYTSPTKTSSNKSKLRTPKKPSPQKPTKKTNLSKRPLNSPNLEWDSGKVRLEILSPEVEVELAQRKRAQLDTELKLQKAKLDSDKLKKSSSMVSTGGQAGYLNFYFIYR